MTVCDMPLRIYGRERLIVSPDSAVFAQLLQGAQFSFTCHWIECVHAFGREPALLMRCLKGAHFISLRRWIQNVSVASNNAAPLMHCRQRAQLSLARRWINSNRLL